MQKIKILVFWGYINTKFVKLFFENTNFSREKHGDLGAMQDGCKSLPEFTHVGIP